ncbi:MAG: hypothetical protein EOP64_05220 [Sphingomonas sp.]|nr:MAG: hypothetical protein EOP64_05220 [Sphingomonas sp.]
MQNLTQTSLGRDLLLAKQATSADEARYMYREVEGGGRGLMTWPLTSSISSPLPILLQLEKNSGIPQRDELADFMRDLDQVMGVREYLSEYGNGCGGAGDGLDQALLDTDNIYIPYIPPLTLPPDLMHTFHDAFDEDDKLNVVKYPTLREYKVLIDAMHSKIHSILNALISSAEMRDKVEST